MGTNLLRVHSICIAPPQWCITLNFKTLIQKFCVKKFCQRLLDRNSSFEALLNKKLYDKLIKGIPKHLKIEEDSVRVYKFKGEGDVKVWGIWDN